jgi:hypothetical protein
MFGYIPAFMHAATRTIGYNYLVLCFLIATNAFCVEVRVFGLRKMASFTDKLSNMTSAISLYVSHLMIDKTSLYLSN